MVQNLVLALLHGIGLLALLAIAFGMIERREWPNLTKALVQGAIFGGGAIFAMMAPATIADGIIVDLRSLIVGFAAAFGGWPAALVAGTIGAGYRLWLGGPGGVPGAVGIVTAALLGLGWRVFLRPKVRLGPVHLIVLGLVLSCYLLSGLMLGFSAFVAVMALVAPYMIAASVLASVMLGLFVDREMGQIAREQYWKNSALTDPLTALPNRRAFERGMELFRVPQQEAALLVLDLDHFKTVNDTFGHAAGDFVLQQIAMVLRASMRQRDLLARLGGEELAVLLPDTGVARARQIANRLRREVAALTINWEGQVIPITVSIGVAVGTGDVVSEHLFLQADGALYAAKHGGRNRVVFAGEMPLRAVEGTEPSDHPAASPHAA